MRDIKAKVEPFKLFSGKICFSKMSAATPVTLPAAPISINQTSPAAITTPRKPILLIIYKIETKLDNV